MKLVKYCHSVFKGKVPAKTQDKIVDDEVCFGHIFPFLPPEAVRTITDQWLFILLLHQSCFPKRCCRVLRMASKNYSVEVCPVYKNLICMVIKKIVLKTTLFSLLLLAAGLPKQASAPGLKLALVKYSGGGDWYSVVDALQNFARFCNEKLGTSIESDYATVEVGSADLFSYPFLIMTGHGNVVFSDQEAENLRNYLTGGGFLLIDDDYGMEPFILPAMKKVFPEQEFVELPFEHPVFHSPFEFKNGLPKIHKHDDKPPQAFALFHEDRIVCMYLHESNITDGWESYDVHKDPEEKRQAALRMGANILQFVFQQ